MENATLFCLLIMLCLSFFMNKGFLNSTTLFIGAFTFVTFMANLHLFGLYSFSDSAYKIILLGCSFFLFGSLIHKVLSLSTRTSNRAISHLQVNPTQNSELIFNYRIFMLLQIISLFCITAVFIQAVTLLLSGDTLGFIRTMFKSNNDEGFFSNNDLLTIFWILIVVPTVYLSLPILLYNIFDRKQNSLLFVLTMVNISMYVISSAGRVLLICTLVYILLLKKRFGFTLSKKQKFSLAVGGGILLGYACFVTVIRAGERTPFEYLYHYFAAPLPLLSYWTANAETNNIQTYGEAFFFGFIGLLNRASRFLNMESTFNNVYDAIAITEFNYLPIFATRKYNAFVTCFYYFYIDFRFVGVMVGSLFYGFVSQWMYTKSKVSYDPRYFVLYLLFMQSIVFSIVRWQFGETKYFLSFIYMIIILFSGKSTMRGKAK